MLANVILGYCFWWWLKFEHCIYYALSIIEMTKLHLQTVNIYEFFKRTQ